MEAQLNEIESALDNLESQNDNIHSKLRELLESNRTIRKEMADLGMIKSASSAGGPNGAASSSAGVAVSSGNDQLPKINDLNIGKEKSRNSNNKDTDSKDKKN